jgi:restriction system protein
MSIWTYSDYSKNVESTKRAVESIRCLFCDEPLACLRSTGEAISVEDSRAEAWTVNEVKVCHTCGWLVRCEIFSYSDGVAGHFELVGASGILRELDLTDVSIPIAEIRSYLAAKFESRFQLHPRVFEEVVASVFGNLGFDSRVTAYSGDDGLDVILDGPSGQVIGVQVKRYAHSIQVEQIRALAGALVLGGMTQGIFVTTSSFQAGATSTAQRLEDRGYKIELMDADRFYGELKIAQRNEYVYKDEEDAPYNLARLHFLDSGDAT